MLRRIVSHLLAPAEAAAAAAPPKSDNLDTFAANAEPGSSGGPPHSLGNWMSSVGNLDEPAAEPVKEKEEPDGKNDPPGDGTVDKGGVEQPPDAAAAAKVKADADTKAAEEAAAKTKTDAEGKESEDDRKMPRSNKDWEAYKAADKKRLAGIQEKLIAAENMVKEFETKYTEVEGKLKEKPPADPEVEARAKQLEAENKALTDKIIELDVTQHPKFKAFYEGGIDKQIGNAKKLVGEDKADMIEKILKLPDGDYKKVQLREFASEMEDDFDKQQLGLIINKISDLKEDREAEIQKAAQHKDKLVTQRANSAAERQKSLEKAFTTVMKQLGDPKEGMVIFQRREGDDAWNAEVKKSEELVQKILSSNDLKPEMIVKLTANAVALPKVLQTFGAKFTEWQAEKSKLEATIKELSKAGSTGGTGNGGSAKANTNGGSRPALKDGMTPHDAAKAWATSMTEAANEAG